MGQLVVISFLQRGSPHLLACEADILNMRTCNAHPFIMHLHQVSHPSMTCPHSKDEGMTAG